MSEMMNKINDFTKKHYRVLVCAFFVLYLILGLQIFKDYGLSTDERQDRRYGLMQFELDQLVNKDVNTSTIIDHGPVFAAVLAGLEKALNLTDTRGIYFMRHLATFLIFYLGVWFFYLLCKYRFRSWGMGLLGSFFLICSPRIFAHSFYNPKDIPFLAICIISIYTLTRYLEQKTLPRLIIHALVCAILVDIRIAGVLVPALTVIFVTGDWLIFRTDSQQNRKAFFSLIIYLCLLALLVMMFWPALWQEPFSRFCSFFQRAVCIPHSASLLYLGNYIDSHNLPWHYLLVWIGVTTPLWYIFCFFVGGLTFLKSLLRNPLMFYLNNKNDLIFFLWLVLPLAAVVIFKSAVYDGWRHLFFIYPALLIFSLWGWQSLLSFAQAGFTALHRKIAVGAVLLTVFSLLSTIIFMIATHPFQQLYFNRLAGASLGQIKNNFELDYWGLSYRKALEYILKNDPSPRISLYVTNRSGMVNADILPGAERSRLVYLPEAAQTKYFLSNYRCHREDYPYQDKYYSLEIDGAEIMVVYKLR